MGFRTLILFWFSSTILRVSSNPNEYCTEKYDPYTSCMVNLFCDRMLKTGQRWIHYAVNNNAFNQGLDYENQNYDSDERHNCKYFQFNGHRMKPINLTIAQFDTDNEDLVPAVYMDYNYNYATLLQFIVILELQGNYNMLYIPNIKSDMSNLKILKITNTGLTLAKLSNKYELPSLQELDLSSNKITEVVNDENEYPYRGLKKINLSDNNLDNVPNLEILRELEEIDISHNNIEVLGPITFEGIKDLISLNLSYNRISDINSSLFRFSKLKVLNLKFNKIGRINANDFEKLTMIEILDLSSNAISSLDKDTFNGLNFLKELNMRDNEIVLIDKEIFTNTLNLKFVDLSANKMTSLPKNLFRGNNLQNFSVEGNILEGSLTRGMFDGLTFVRNLDLSFQFLDTIEDYAFYGLTNLEIISLHHNKIENLTSKCFGTLRNLKELDLSFNMITEISFDEQDLFSLEMFILKNNRLSTVNSNNFNGMTALRYLDLSNNKINHIEPNSFESLHNLVSFEISNNPLEGVLSNGTFEGLNSLPTLDISSSLLTVIQNNSFYGMTQLLNLNVSHSKINTVQFNAFSQTGSVYSLDLSFNEITEFSINATDFINLGEIYLNNNKIKFLSSFLFQNIPHLSTLIVSFNQIEEISPLSFSETNNLETVDFSYNKKLNLNISLIQNMKKLKFLSLSGIKKEMSCSEIDVPVTKLVMSNSSIKDVESLHLNNLKQLNTLTLSHNNITKLEYTAFANISSLKYLDISYNSITYIQPGTFKDNHLLVSLNMSHNSLNAIAYGILRGLVNLNTMDVSYNQIKSLQNERFYEASNLKTLIVDYNNIESFTPNDFHGAGLSVVSLGNNPIPCETLVNFKQNEMYSNTFDITAITLDEHNDENVHGIICNKKKDAYSKKFEYYTNSLSNNSDSVLINIRDILLDKLNTQTNNKKTDNEKYFSSLTEQFNKFAETNNEKFEKLEKNNELLNTKLVNLTSQNLEAVQTSITKSDKTNLLLEKIFRVLSNKSNTTPLLTKDNATYENLLQYINKVKQGFEDDMLFEKRNIMDEVDSKIAHLKSSNINASLLTNKIEHLEQKSAAPDQSLFTETCVVFILIILIVILLFLVYKSGIFVRKRFSISTRELPSAMDSTL